MKLVLPLKHLAEESRSMMFDAMCSVLDPLVRALSRGTLNKPSGLVEEEAAPCSNETDPHSCHVRHDQTKCIYDSSTRPQAYRVFSGSVRDYDLRRALETLKRSLDAFLTSICSQEQTVGAMRRLNERGLQSAHEAQALEATINQLIVGQLLQYAAAGKADGGPTVLSNSID